MNQNPTTEMTPAIQAAIVFPREITLPSGLVASQHRPIKGRDAVTAHRIAGEASAIEQGCAMVAQVVTLSGKPVVMEDLLELDLDDLTVLTETVVGKSSSSTRKP